MTRCLPYCLPYRLPAARRFPARCLLALLVGSALAAAQAQQAPAPVSQRPLLNRSASGVKPNIMLMLDDSGSMADQFMPEGVTQVGPVRLSSPGRTSVRFHPDESPGSSVVAAIPGSSSWRQRFLRSPDTNSLYYSPAVRYRPWPSAGGGRLPDAQPAAALVDPIRDQGRVDLTRNKAAAGQSARSWCFAPDTRFSGCAEGHVDFAPGLYYRLRRSNGVFLDPRDPANYDEFDVNAAAPAVAKSLHRTDCLGAVCTLAEEQQNFANWFVYHRSRMLAAKGAIAEALADAPNTFRLGWGRINKVPGPVDGVGNFAAIETGVREYDTQRRDGLLAWLHAVRPLSSTPLRLALQEVGRYYGSSDDRGPWGDTPGTASGAAHKTCRRAYTLMVTDGYWNDTVNVLGLSAVGNVDGSRGPKITGPGGREWTYIPAPPYSDTVADTLADYALHYWRTDLRPDLANEVVPSTANPAFWQSMTTFTVGLGVQGTLDPAVDLPALVSGEKKWGTDNIDDLWHAALNSRGQYFSAADPQQLSSAITAAVRSAAERELVEAGVATAATALQANNRKYVPRYKTGAWSGDVEALVLDRSGQAGIRAWSAREKLPAWGDRRIFTWDTGLASPAGVPFAWASLSAGSRTALGATANAALVDYLRGDRSAEAAGWRVRDHVLGDFVNSNPVFAGGGAEPFYDQLPDGVGDAYKAFVAGAKATRPGVLYIGGNDGMLHGFQDRLGQANDGREVFAYVPQAVFPFLSVLANPSYGTADNYHRYFVDGPLRVADVHVPPAGSTQPAWRNYLFGSTGAGARAVFAVDVTDPAQLGASSIRWEVSAAGQPELGHVFAPLAVGPLPDGTWVALFGNGYGSASGKAVLFVVKVATGEVSTVVVADGPANGLGGVGVARDAAGRITAVYAGDIRGSLWRLDYKAGAAGSFVVANAGKALFQAPADQPIVEAPLVVPGDKGGRLLAFGTGRLVTDADAQGTAVQSLYVVQDVPGDAMARPLDRAALAARSLASEQGTDTSAEQVYFSVTGSAVNWATQRGWYADLSLSGYAGMRLSDGPQRVGDRFVLFSAVVPGFSASDCSSAQGRGANFMVPIESGLPPPRPLFDTNGDGLYSAADKSVVGYATAADGVDAVLLRDAQPAVGDSSADPASCQRQVSLQNASGQTSACLDPLASRTIKDRIWRRIVNPPF